MKLLLITTLYPGHKNQSRLEASYAVHNFAKEWAKENEVKVIRLWPYYAHILNFLKKIRAVNRYAYTEDFILDGVNITRIPIKKVPKISYKEKDIRLVSKQIIKIINKEGIPDVVLCDMLNPSIYVGEIIATKYSSILIASLHNSDIFYLSNKDNYRQYIKIDKNVHTIVFRSERIKESFLKLYDGNKSEKDYFTILFGINKKDIIDINKLEKKISNPNKVIMTASSLKKLKNVNILIEAFAKIKDKKGYILKIIGDGPERIRLEKQVKDLGAEDYIFFEGKKTRNQVLNIMEESDIFAMVSSPETFGLVYVEAMGKGCVTIGSKGEGIDGVIVNNENGFLCKPNNVEDLQLTLERVINLDLNEKKRIINNAIMTANRLNHDYLAEEFLRKIKETEKRLTTNSY